MRVLSATLCLVLASTGVEGGDVEICPGEGPRYGDFKCNHDGTHRVCAQLVNKRTSLPLLRGGSDFWGITNQKAWQWDDKIVG